jgi:hypothetical protein
MNINWQLKSAAFRVIDAFALYRLLYAMQKHLTGRSVIRIDAINENWATHRDQLATLEHPTVLEFGAGKSLAQNIYLSRFLRSQTVVDLFPMLDIGYFNEAARQIAALLKADFTKVATIEEIARLYRIQYQAPLDLTMPCYPDDSFDACISTNTLEHIPREAIVAIFKQLRRMIRPEGLVSAVIDYSDHYAHTDNALSELNFLSYTDKQFRKHNHRSHFQNRLRHYDFERLFIELGFEVLRSDPLNPVPLPHRVASDFDMTAPSIRATRGIFLLKNAKSPAGGTA